MTDQTATGSTNPDAEAQALAAAKLKQPPPIQQAAAAPIAPAATVRVIDQTKVAAALAAVQQAITLISQAGDVVSDLQLATAGCNQAVKWLGVCAAKAAAAAPKA